MKPKHNSYIRITSIILFVIITMIFFYKADILYHLTIQTDGNGTTDPTGIIAVRIY